MFLESPVLRAMLLDFELSPRRLWTAAGHKRSGLFIDLLRKIDRACPTARRSHVIVDNDNIHSSRQTQLALTSRQRQRALAGRPRLRLHFLPPYCPELNPTQRVWLDLHAAVTRSHRCATIDELMSEVHDCLRCRNRSR